MQKEFFPHIPELCDTWTSVFFLFQLLDNVQFVES
jgi:hypothetical protein